MNHQLKTETCYFEAVQSRVKMFEIRFNDRDFKVGDVLILREIEDNDYTGRVLTVHVTYITHYKQKPGYVVIGISH